MQAQPSSSRLALSPEMIAALERVHVALRKTLTVIPCLSPTSLQSLAERLADNGLLVTLRCGLGVGINSPYYLSTLRHSFLICQEGSSGLCVVVDPFFREQFKVAGMPPTSAYSSAVKNLPECFVGSIGTVNALVCLLFDTLFHETTTLGIELPPWRSMKAHLSKWLPQRFNDTVFTPPSLVNLHPALRNSVHGPPLSTSPTSVQSWSSLERSNSERSCSHASSSAACSSGASSAFGRSRGKRPASQLPHIIISGFTPASSPSCPAAGASFQADDPASSQTCRTIVRSALTEELASAFALSRTVRAEAEDCWNHVIRNLQQQKQVPEKPKSSVEASSAVDALSDEVGSSSCSSTTPSLLCGGGGGGSVYGSVLRSLVLLPVHRHPSGGGGRLKRGGDGNLKLTAVTLKVLPRVYTMKIGTAV